MQANEVIKPGLDYIERNLKTTITAEELADMAGYSVWHYSRLFLQVTDLSVAAFISKRRLDRALGEIIGGRRAIDAALEYGFDTYAGFFKAFVKMYGNSPKSYLKKEIPSMFTEQEIRDLLTNWDIPQDLPILDVYILDGAKVSGNVWSIGEEYILKTEKRESLLHNLKIAKALAAQNFAAATPIPTKAGAEYLEGDQLCNQHGSQHGDQRNDQHGDQRSSQQNDPHCDYITVLTRGIKGSPLAKADRFGENRRAFGHKYGASIARLHNALKVIEPDINAKDVNQYSQVMEWAMPETKKQNIQYNIGLPDSYFNDYVSVFGELFDKLPKQLIHRDPNPSNILFYGGEVSGFIDFDLSHRNIRLFDPCYCATGILSEWRDVEKMYEKWPEVLKGILYGYNSVNPLTKEEKEAVFYVICSIQMVFAAYCEPQNELKELAKTNREMLRYIVDNKDSIISIFGGQ